MSLVTPFRLRWETDDHVLIAGGVLAWRAKPLVGEVINITSALAQRLRTLLHRGVRP